MKNWINETFWPWFKCASIRAIKTFAQAFVAQVGVEMVALSAINWPVVLSVCLMALVLSFATSLAGLPELEEH